MTDLIVRKDGRAGRITLNRPKALNALTWDMVLGMSQALQVWRADPGIALVIIDATGDRAFCSGGDIAEMYASGRTGDLDYGRRFWRDEYRMNHLIATYPKPIVSFMQGYTMGGGVGVGCHASHRIVDDSARIAMPECSIGLIPDVGGTWLLARAPGHLGAYLGLTGARMQGADAIHAGFADHYIPGDWEDLKQALCETGHIGVIPDTPAPVGPLQAAAPEINAAFAAATLPGIIEALPDSQAMAARMLGQNAPLAMEAGLQLIRRQQAQPDLAQALRDEYRYVTRAVAQGDFIEGIRAAIVDKDRNPRWHPFEAKALAAMLAPLGAHELTLEEIA